MSVIWTIVIGFVAGVIAKFIMPGDKEPSGFILTTVLGIVGAFVASYLGQALGWYRPGEGAGLIGAVIGAIIVLLSTAWWPVGGAGPFRLAALGPALRASENLEGRMNRPSVTVRNKRSLLSERQRLSSRGTCLRTLLPFVSRRTVPRNGPAPFVGPAGPIRPPP